jgi:DNA ligase-1
MTTTWPTLYKQNTKGGVQQWHIAVSNSTIITTYGQKDGKQQETRDEITEGKNIGKKNATTPAEQAVKEAQSRFEKQGKKGYVAELTRAENAETDIAGGITPMLAHTFADHGEKIVWPAYVQPKLDGIRCLAIIGEHGTVTLWTRTRKPITSVPHINAAIASLGLPIGFTLDGELYNHDLKAEFEQIVSLVRHETPRPGHERVEYHIYDCAIADMHFQQRWKQVTQLISTGSVLKPVSCLVVANYDQALDFYKACMAAGYEGIMVRNADSVYEPKRSYHLQKIKEFEDAEFKVIGMNEGRGKLAGHVGSFVCETGEGVKFDVKLRGDTSQLQRLYQEPSLWQNKVLTVQFQGLTNTNKVPRFPVGLRFRDSPDF